MVSISPEIVIAIISSLVGGLFVAIANNLFTRRKTEAEAVKLRAEAEKIKAEAEKVKLESQKLAVEIEKLNSSVGEANYYTLSSANERVIYDGRKGIEGYDFKATSTSKVFHEIRNGTLIIRRPSNKGVYKIQACKYIYNIREKEYLPKNELLTGPRKLRISCEVKVTQGHHSLVFAITSIPKNQLLDRNEILIDQTEWTEVSLYFRFPSHYDCVLQIVDLPKSQPGSLQIRKLFLAERVE